MIRNIGHIMYEVTCPLCNNGFLSDGDEIITLDNDDSHFGFRCPECQRTMRITDKNIRHVKVSLKFYKRFMDGYFDEEDEDDD